MPALEQRIEPRLAEKLVFSGLNPPEGKKMSLFPEHLRPKMVFGQYTSLLD
jgi:hypothetical protein